MNFSIREATQVDLIQITNYFTSKPNEYWLNMGVDPNKLPNKIKLLHILQEEFDKPIEDKQLFHIIWFVDGTAVGHSNINKIKYGQEAEIHLHLWDHENTKNGVGIPMLKLSIKRYFELFKLSKLFCEPYAKNIAPNIIIPKLGFEFMHAVRPNSVDWIHLDVEMNRYVLTKEKFNSLKEFYSSSN
ncbi:MAG: GNAT family protein [Maribacter arcticus]|uniref:GNAT family N-acetyltransferase n=1 Tax=Maribacter arcticus TaxID=561365 RepID=UPI0030010BF3